MNETIHVNGSAHCNTLQHTATHCSSLQHCATLPWMRQYVLSNFYHLNLKGGFYSAEIFTRMDVTCFLWDGMNEKNANYFANLTKKSTLDYSRYAREISCKKHNTLQHTATECNTLQHTAMHCNGLQHFAPHCNVLQHTATHCNTLQHTARYCKTLRHTATHCNTL